MNENKSGISRRAFLSLTGITGLGLAFKTQQSSAQPADAERTKDVASEASAMNPRFTFDSFVAGPNSQFAHAAALAVAQSPARVYNPLFLYGGTRVGKTHLLQAIGNRVASSSATAKVIYVSSERFWDEFIDAIQNATLVKFRARYRTADVLLIDDVHFFSGKEPCQEEFLHTFNTLFDGHKQIVLSSNRPPSEIANLEERLARRFEWGLTAELQPPGIETRLAILRRKAQALEIEPPEQLLEVLARRTSANVRQLERALMRFASLAGGN
jgi:chromosomal replication initiator protein